MRGRGKRKERKSKWHRCSPGARDELAQQEQWISARSWQRKGRKASWSDRRVKAGRPQQHFRSGSRRSVQECWEDRLRANYNYYGLRRPGSTVEEIPAECCHPGPQPPQGILNDVCDFGYVLERQGLSPAGVICTRTFFHQVVVRIEVAPRPPGTRNQPGCGAGNMFGHEAQWPPNQERRP